MTPQIQTIPTKVSAFSPWLSRTRFLIKPTLLIVINGFVIGYFSYATYHFTDLVRRCPYQDWPPQNSSVETDSGTCRNPCELQFPEEEGRCPCNCGIQWCDGYGMLLILFITTYAVLFYYQIVKRCWGSRLDRTFIAPIVTTITKWIQPAWTKRIIAGVIICALLAFVIFDSLESPERLQSMSGIFILFGFGFVFSTNRKSIKFRPVVLGFVFQFLLGVISIRWEVGRNIFRCIGNKITVFMGYGVIGSRLVHGDYLVDSYIFVFSTMPVAYYFGLCISILYYFGVVQMVVKNVGWMLQSVLDTTVCESVACAVNIFLGMADTVLLIRPYLKHLTASEMHAVMSSGLATVAGSLLAAYVAYGAEPAHLVTSSIMAAPAALAFTKLFYPETEKSQTRSENIVFAKSEHTSVLDAASNGAQLAIPMILAIAANLIAFISFMVLMNAIVNFFGHLVGLDITFEVIFAKLFIPLAWIIGIPWSDCENVAKLISTKMLVNEFVAFERLGVMKRNHLISLRSSAIATYAICGFANPSSMGIAIASMSAMAPERRMTITSVAIRAFISGSIICFLTASIAGLLMTDDISEEIGNTQVFFAH